MVSGFYFKFLKKKLYENVLTYALKLNTINFL